MTRTTASGFLLTLIFASACKKVINVDLKSTSPQIVIEGNVTDAGGPYKVKISKTVDFSADNVYPPVTNATVFITDSTNGITEKLIQADSGVYLTTDFVGVSGHTYGMLVNVDGRQYTAGSTMPKRVSLDSITFAENVNFNNQLEINAIVNFQDPIGLGNYYMFTEYVNSRQIPNIFVFEDRLSDGRYIQDPLYNDSAYLQKNDTLVLNMDCIDRNTYNYFYTLLNVTGNNNFQSVTPANPVGNISNGALGYFSAHTTERVAITVY
ncbi:MAG TPA: DUF4249 family protein [Puia sp.]|nr:DUF4249 family protein [Puia sp.]